ncbi:hypothetical protein Ciccas_009595 [Cichlidogyrus casuarinus]|uniref:Uncharacterized protein n=1 Tax=Cichlidogyrus casuarinus TaxID=1844966 RepID=A0ABD2PWK2_9PLAT
MSNTELIEEILAYHDLPHVAIPHAYGSWSTRFKKKVNPFRVDAFMSDKEMNRFIARYVESLEEYRAFILMSDHHRDFSSFGTSFFDPNSKNSLISQIPKVENTNIPRSQQEFDAMSLLQKTTGLDNLIVSIPGSKSIPVPAEQWIRWALNSQLLNQHLFWLFTDVGDRTVDSFKTIIATLVLKNSSTTTSERNVNMAWISAVPTLSNGDCLYRIRRRDFLASLLQSLPNCDFGELPQRVSQTIIAAHFLGGAFARIAYKRGSQSLDASTGLDTPPNWNCFDNTTKFSMATSFMEQIGDVRTRATADIPINEDYPRIAPLALTTFGSALTEEFPVISGLFPNEFHSFDNATFRIASTMSIPYYFHGNIEKDLMITNPTGMCFDILNELAKSLQFK